MRWITLIGLLALSTACSHPLEIVGSGDITSQSGQRDCTEAEFLAADPNCSQNIIVGDYDEDYRAVASTGWDFFGWSNYCLEGGKNSCHFDIDAQFTGQFWGQTVPPLIANFSPGITFDWRFSNGATRDTHSFTQTLDGVTATARAYAAEWNGTDYTIYGPFPTQNATNITVGVQDGFYRSETYDGLMLEAGPIGGIALSGIDGGNGFSSWSYYTPVEAIEINRFEFAIVIFSQPVDLAGTWINRISNHARSLWLASGSTDPDFNLDFSTAFSGFATSGHHSFDQQMDDPKYGATGMANTHSGLSFLVIGAPPSSGGQSFPGMEDASKDGGVFTGQDNFALSHVVVRKSVP